LVSYYYVFLVLDVFKVDPEYLEHEEKYKELSKEIVGDVSGGDEEDGDSDDDEEDDDDEDGDGETQGNVNLQTEVTKFDHPLAL